MNSPLGPVYLRRRIGRALRQRREELGIKRNDAAKYVGLQPGTMSKIELGKQNIGIGNLRALIDYYEIDPKHAEELLVQGEQANQRGWWSKYGDGVLEWFRDYIGLEADARQILFYAVEPLPGLLQTDAYAAAVTRGSWPEGTDEDIGGVVEIRRTRRELLQPGRTPSLHFVVNEAALHRQVGDIDVMREQLKYLVEVAGRDEVTFQILPFNAGAHPGMKGAFAVLRFRDDPDDEFATVYVEIEPGALYPDRAVDLERYSLIHSQLCGLALDEQASVKRITEVIQQL